MSENLQDSLSEMLFHYALHARIYAAPQFCSAWRLNPSGQHQAGFHLVTSGECWLHGKKTKPVLLRQGDLVFVARDCWHVFASNSELSDVTSTNMHFGDDHMVELLCGSVEFPRAGGEALLAGLPELQVITADSLTAQDNVLALASLMAAEATGTRPGRGAVFDSLGEVLFVYILRHIMSSGQSVVGLLAGLADPYVGRALGCIHREFQQRWTLEQLANAAGLSRSAFARRFQAIVGETPMNYLTQYRMQKAEQWLRERRHSVAQIAAMLGYESDAAFRRAFKRLKGRGPGELRRGTKSDETANPK